MIPSAPQTPVDSGRGFSFALEEQGGRLALRALHHPGYGAISADWSGPDLKRRIAAGRRQLLARAVGLDRHRDVHLLDGTGGLGRDAFVLAALGARVTLSERHVTVFRLLDDAHRRALADPASAEAASRMEIVHGDARTLLARGWDVIYLDPMYPDQNKTALAKKEMQLLRELTGGDEDADGLLPYSRAHARRRVAIKRPLKAPHLADTPPQHCLRGSQARFDIYLPSAPCGAGPESR